jgi:hypothetical protein
VIEEVGWLVGVEEITLSLSSVDSAHLTSATHLKTGEKGAILWPDCGQDFLRKILNPKNRRLGSKHSFIVPTQRLFCLAELSYVWEMNFLPCMA